MIITSGNFGPIKSEFNYDLRDGYTVLVGPNNSGKSAVLQLVFRKLMESGGEGYGPNAVCLITADRMHVLESAQPGDRDLEVFNNELHSIIASQNSIVGFAEPRATRELPRLLLDHDDFSTQLTKLNVYLEKLGLPTMQLRTRQTMRFEDVQVHFQGNGIRCLLPILAAMTDSRLKAIIIDEPEISLEPLLQRKLRDILLELSREKIVLMATHSHLFLKKDEASANHRVTKEGDLGTVITPLSTMQELFDVVFGMLGNDIEDLFLPANYMVVEGSADQKIMEKVVSLLSPDAKIKIIASGGITKVESQISAVESVITHLVPADNPYSKRVVAVIDEPQNQTETQTKDSLSRALSDRLYVLDKPTIEDYIHESLYQAAGLDKNSKLAELNAQTDKETKIRVKTDISNKISSVLVEEHLDNIPLIKEAALKAIANSTRRR
jgi:energy-coupling factor transporter ATP-binding protein EcfA2